ncbi:hypothetical protein FBY35_3942 [Streptomyces sp. SLBN-118]|uniref:cellulose biosynthesis cyclic di-GMP-binding regulatory protein BcsB n=1 Tax=Streptomyces sp. SLBN-118 TaxID=2768454 RepID=UPI0011501110|nr:cellulose biosynthesis cyclic di-GMP-binding regulatory protein BcsB [Streptomyces sp. SLBN-118]TQK42524.1 hypothetical protein FBY35_3942 [Streptomyces sp. SLBN-118]
MLEIEELLERQRLLARILNRGAGAGADPVGVTVTSPADAGADEDRDVLASRRTESGTALGETLRDVPGLADELSGLLPERPNVQTDGERSVAVAGNNCGIISTGDGAKNALHQ